MRILISENSKNKVAISFPSLRVETITRNLMEEIKKIRKTGFTIAPEAGTQRLRDFINKGITEEEIISAASKIYSSGWNLIKLYFMIGLPTETSEDLNGIIDLSKKISAIDHRKQLNVSVSTFVPKPHTPFQWEKQESSETILAKQKLLKDNLRKRQIHFKWHNSSLSILEGIFSRGDRKLCNVLIKAHQMGAGFEAWTEHFKPELWDRAFSECGIDKNIYLNRREIGECLPWAHISCGINSDFLIKELDKAQTGQITHDCRTHGCAGCGICEKIDISVKNLEADCNVQSFTHNAIDTMSSDVENSPVQPDSNNSSYRYCIHFTKTGPARFLSHLELSRCFARAMRRSQLPLKYSNGFHPLPRIIFSEALPVGMESGSEMLYVDLMEKLDENEMIHKINSHLPEGIEALTSEEIPLEKSLSADTIKKYLISFPENTALDFPSNSEIKHLIEIFNNKKEFIVQSVKNSVTFQTDLKEIVRRIDLGGNSALEIELDLTNRKIPRLTEITGYILNLGDKEKKAMKILKL
jgi:radical SAM-linked protein